MWLEIKPIPRGEFGNVIKEFANRNLPFIYTKENLTMKLKKFNARPGLFKNDYDDD